MQSTNILTTLHVDELILIKNTWYQILRYKWWISRQVRIVYTNSYITAKKDWICNIVWYVTPTLLCSFNFLTWWLVLQPHAHETHFVNPSYPKSYQQNAQTSTLTSKICEQDVNELSAKMQDICTKHPCPTAQFLWNSIHSTHSASEDCSINMRWSLASWFSPHIQNLPTICSNVYPCINEMQTRHNWLLSRNATFLYQCVIVTGRSLDCQVENHVRTKKIYFF